MAKFNHLNKLVQALCYLASKQPKGILGFTKAYKLLWLADRWHLRQYGRTITGDRYFALPHGIIPSDAKHVLDGEDTIMQGDVKTDSVIKVLNNGHQFKSINKPDINVFSDSDQEALDKVLARFGTMKGNELSELSHKFPEWEAYEKELNDDKKKDAYLVNMDLFFDEGPKECADFFEEDPNLLEVTKEMYHMSNPK